MGGWFKKGSKHPYVIQRWPLVTTLRIFQSCTVKILWTVNDVTGKDPWKDPLKAVERVFPGEMPSLTEAVTSLTVITV